MMNSNNSKIHNILVYSNLFAYFPIIWPRSHPTFNGERNLLYLHSKYYT